VVLLPPSIEDDCPEPSEEDNLPTPEIRVHIAINIVSHLNAAEEFRSLPGEELLLHEFLLDQILLLRESLEPCLVPRVVEELLGTKLVSPPMAKDIPCPLVVVGTVAKGELVAAPTAKDTPCPPAVVGKVVEGCSVVDCAPPPSSRNASVVVHGPTGAQILLLPSQMSETRSSSIQVVLSQRIPYVLWLGKMAKPFKARPPELAALRLGPMVPSCRQARPTGVKFFRQRLGHSWSYSPRPLHGGDSSLIAPSRHFGMPHGLPRVRRVIVIDAASVHHWSYGRFGLGLGVLAWMCCMLAGFQD
jgi:hypothetical protein